ncbi:MAG: DUF2779 domain-containing protein [Bacteroidia bacterium]
MKPLLSKTSFLKSVQCTKAFFLYKYHYQLKDPLPKEKQAVFNRGHQVGELAQSLFPDGIDVSPTHVSKFADSVKRTKELILQGQKVIYEAAFVFDSVLIALDILVNKDGLWYAYEVKSSLKITPVYVMDAALQYYVLINSLPNLKDFYLVTINADYILEDEFDVHTFFKFKSVKADAEKNLEFIKYHINAAKEVYANNQLPQVAIGEKCFTPYQCDFYGTCWKHIPANNVFEFSGISKKLAQVWFEQGFTTINDIPETSPLSFGEGLGVRSLRMVQSYKNNTELINKPALQQFYAKIKYPIAFFDAEMYAPAIPQYKGTSPFEALPFLFSWHSLDKEDAKLAHDYFFQEESPYRHGGFNPPAHQIAGQARNDVASPLSFGEGKGVRCQLLDKLLSLASQVNTILVFDTGQELKALSAIVKHFPQYKEAINQLKNKFIDFSDVFTNLWYYHPQTKGAMSLKKIHEAVFNKNIYHKLSIQSGLLASYKYADYLKETATTSPPTSLQRERGEAISKQKLKADLINYCKTDTQAMVDLFQYIKNLF